MPNTVGPYLASSLHIDAEGLASISDKYFLANVIFLFPAGMLLDRFSTRKIIILAMIVAIVCTFLFALGQEVWQLALVRFITGVAGSFCLLSNVRLASRWFPPKKMALVVGLLVTFAMLGGMVAQMPFEELSHHLGWRNTVRLDAVFGVLLLLVIVIFVRDCPSNTALQDLHVSLKGREFWRALAKAVSSRQNWFAGLYTSLLNLPIFIFGAMWGVFYLSQVWHLSKRTPSIITSLLFVGIIIGSPLVGWFSDKIQRRKLPMILGSLLSLVLILILMLSHHLSAWSLGVLFFAIGFVSSAQIISYPLIAESNPLTMTATAEGFASVLIMGGGYIQLIFAYFLQLHWDHLYIKGQPIYSFTDYELGLSILPIAYVISLILALFVRESYCRPYREKHLEAVQSGE